MRTLRLLLLFFSLLFSLSTVAQAVHGMSGAPREFESTSQIYDQLRKFLNAKEKDPYKIDWNTVKGSPYLYENYKPGVFSINDEIYGNIMMRYNTYTDEVELMTADNQEAEALMKIEGSAVKFHNEKLQLFTYKDENGYEKKQYFLVLSAHDDMQLLLRKKCVFSPAEKAVTQNQADRAAKFTQYNYFYIVDKNGNFTEVSPKRKAVVAIFPEREKAIKKYIKSNKLKLKEPDDFAALIDYLNSL